MSRAAFAVAALLLVLAINLPALVQLARTGGPLYYSNADGEPLYLQYDTSLATQSPFSRTGQYPVTAMHLAGLSGGWINLVWDVLLPLAFLALVRAIGQELRLPDPQSTTLAVLATFGPALASAANPLVKALVDWNLGHATVRWLTVPGGSFLPIVRTPEPQFSLVVLATAVLLGLRWKSFLPVYASLPVLYPFVAVTAGFVALALHLRRPLAAWIAVAAACGLVFALTAGPEARALMVETRAPVVSFTSIMAMALWMALRTRLRKDLRRPSLLLALAPLAAENVHVLTGWMAQPMNVEQYAGVECVALILGLAASARPLGLAVAGVALLVWLPQLALETRRTAEMPIVDAAMLQALRTDAGRVAVSDRLLVRMLSLVHPRQPMTALDPWQTWRFFVPLGSAGPDDRFERYLDARNEIRRDPRRAEQFRALLETLDHGYTHRGEDFVLYHMGRKERFSVDVDVEAAAARRPPRPGRLIFGRLTPEGFLTVDRD